MTPVAPTSRADRICPGQATRTRIGTPCARPARTARSTAPSSIGACSRSTTRKSAPASPRTSITCGDGVLMKLPTSRRPPFNNALKSGSLRSGSPTPGGNDTPTFRVSDTTQLRAFVERRLQQRDEGRELEISRRDKRNLSVTFIPSSGGTAFRHCRERSAQRSSGPWPGDGNAQRCTLWISGRNRCRTGSASRG